MQNNKKSTEQVLARRLRPIYDAVDGAQYKKAIVEADKVLKKHPQTHTAKALKALALIRSDRSSDALVMLNALEKDLIEQEFDENTVQALSHCYKELNNPQRIAALYALLVKRNPGNEQLARELFYSYVRIKNFRQQQQIAMQLYKDTKVSHYYCWALMSVLLQGYNDEKLGTSMFFPLAEKMLEKISLDELHTIAGGIDLHLLVLESRKKYAEAIGLIESNLKPLGDTHSDEQLRQRVDHFYKLAKDGDALTARAIAGIEKDPNELGNWKNLADCLMLHTEPDLREEALRNACQIIAHFEEGSPTSDAINFSLAERRGILLGRLMLLKSLFMADIPMEEQRLVDTLLGTPIALLKSLANIVLDKPYGFADLSPFLHLLSADESDQLIGHVETIPADEHKKDKIWPIILLEQLKFHFNPPLRLSDEQLDAMVKRATIKFVDEFAVNNSQENGDSAQINGVQMTAYAQLIVQYWWEMCMRKGEGRFEYLIELIAFIEWIYANHPDCTASIPITLCRLYGIFGDISRIETLERQISLKFIQRDSLAFLHFFVPYQFGKFKNANIYYTSLGAMYDMNEREVNECLVSAYKNHCFSQIPKLMEFATRSSKSIFSIGADVLNRCLTGCFAVNSTELTATAFLGDNEPAMDWQTVADNRDFSVFPPIIPSQIIEKICDSSLREMRSFFKLKHHLLLAIAQIGTEQMAESANGFFNALEECREQFSESSNDGLEKMLESFVWLRFDQLMAPSNNLLQLPANLLSFATNLSSQQNADEQEKSLQIFEKYLNEVFDFYAKFNLNELAGRIESIRNLAISLEMMAICLIGCKLLAERVAPAPAQAKSSSSQQPLNGTMSQQAGGGKGEKRKQQQSKNPHMDPINRRLHLLGQAIRRMHEFISAPEFKNDDNLCKRTVDSENARNFLPKTVQTQIHQILAEQVSPSLDRAISSSTAELTDAICHLLVNHLSVDVQALNIRANK